MVTAALKQASFFQFPKKYKGQIKKVDEEGKRTTLTFKDDNTHDILSQKKYIVNLVLLRYVYAFTPRTAKAMKVIKIDLMFSLDILTCTQNIVSATPKYIR